MDNLKQSYLVEVIWIFFSTKVRLATMTHLHIWYGNCCSHYRFCLIFLKKLIDLEVKQLWCKFQAHCLTLTPGREWNVKHFLCHGGKLRATMTHPLATKTHIWKTLKTVRPPWHNRQKIFTQKDFVLLTEMWLFLFCFNFHSLWSSIENNTLF